MKLFSTFTIALLLAVALQPIASSSLAVKDVQGSPTPSQALELLALDKETHKKVADRADPLKVAKFIEVYELFKKRNIGNIRIYKEETLDLALAYVPCEIAWHLRIIAFDEAIQCLEKSASWKAVTKIGDQLLVNLFADKHTFELIQLLKTTDIGDDDLLLNLRKMVSSEGLPRGVPSAFFLQHALALHKNAPESLERREMVKNFLSLHLSEIAAEFGQEIFRTLYTRLMQNAPTLLSGGSPTHAITVVATRVKKDEYDIVIINSGAGIENHESTTEIQPKGFHTGASYDDASTSKLVKATSYNPLVRIKGIDAMDLWSASYHSGPSLDRVYYVVKNASSHVVTEPLMPWEWTESQGIGTCSATSVWFALRFYYQALAYENDLRLSMLDQAISDLEELQDKVEGLEHQLNAHYQEAWEAFKKAHADYKKLRFDYDQSPVKDLALAKEKSTKTLHLRRTILSMALNEILRNLIVWHHELGDIATKLLFDRSKGELFTKTTEYSKMMQRREVLADAIPQSMASFHNFWKLQEEKYEERQKTASGKEAASSSVLDSWHSIREDVRTMYNDAIRVLKSKSASEMVLAKEAFVAQKFKPIDVKSLDEHSSLAKILGYIINFGDSPALRDAISEHIKTHTKNANATNYLIVLYACLMKDVPLLNYLVVQQKLPLRYTIDRTKRAIGVSMYRDLETEESIAALAAHELVQYGQPLDAFPQLFRMSKKKTQGIINIFKDTYREIAPIINVEKPSQEDIDKAFEGFVESGTIAAVAYTLPSASEKAISNAFIETDRVRVLSLLIDSVQDSKLLKQKIAASIEKDNAEIVELLLPSYLRDEKRRTEINLIRGRKPGSDITSQLVEVSLPDRLLDVAYDRNAIEVIQFLAPLSKKSSIKRLLLKAVKDEKFEVARGLTRHVTGDAILAMLEEANTGGHADLAKALMEEYASKKPIEGRLLKAVEDGNLDELEKWMLNVSVDTIGYALFKAAEKGEMKCFEKLVPHSTDKSISAALSKLSDENINHPSVLKAVNNASRLSTYKEIIERAIRASNVDLLVRMLSFMSAVDVDRFFKVAFKNAKSFEIRKHLLPFAGSENVNTCLEAAVKGEMEGQIILLLSRVDRKKLSTISQSPEFEKLGKDKDTRQATENRIKNFPTEVAIELAFLPEKENDIRRSLKVELGEYNAKLKKDETGLACTDHQSCIDMMERMDSSALAFPIEQAIGRLLWSEENNAALEELLRFATPYACRETMGLFSEHKSEKAAKGCAGKALKDDVLETAQSAQNEKNFGLMKSLIPFLSPLGIIELLESSSSEQIDSDRVKEILSDLPRDLADDALRIAVRGDEKNRKESVHYLLPKASQAAIDEVYLFAKRIKFDDELLEKSASVTAKA